MKLYVPTFYGNAKAKEIEEGKQQEFGDPHVPILAYSSQGLSVILGALDSSDNDAPDIQIERRPNGWAIFLHPVGGGDPSGYVYFIDDGRSFVIPENPACSTPAIVESNWDTVVALVDKLP